MYAQQLLSALAVVGLAAAQSTGTCSQPTVTVNSQADASALANCQTITGDVVIGSQATEIHLDGPEQITGGLIAHDAVNLITLGSTSLNSIKTLDLMGLTVLSTFSFGMLTSVSNISFNALPNLASLTLPSVIRSAKDVLVQNTFLHSLDGINLASANSLTIYNNNLLTSFSTQIANVSGVINIANNGQALNVQFPNLMWAEGLNVRNISSLSIPSLSTVNGSLGLLYNYFTTVNAPNLTKVGDYANKMGSFAIIGNTALTNFSAPLLSTVGGAVVVENNTLLSAIDFPKLADVGGAIDLLGNFSTFSLPAVSNVQGGAVIESTDDIGSSCSSFKSSEGNAVQGTYACAGLVASATGTAIPTVTSGGANGASSSPAKKNSGGRHGVEEAVAGLSVIGALMQMLL